MLQLTWHRASIDRTCVGYKDTLTQLRMQQRCMQCWRQPVPLIASHCDVLLVQLKRADRELRLSKHRAPFMPHIRPAL